MVEGDRPGRRLERRAVAEMNSWHYRVEEMSQVIEARLSEATDEIGTTGISATSKAEKRR